MSHVFENGPGKPRKAISCRPWGGGFIEVEEEAIAMTRATVTKGSGNAFLDLGYSEGKFADLILKSSLLQAFQEAIKERG